MHRLLILLFIIIILGGGYWYYTNHREIVENKLTQTVQQIDQQTNSSNTDNSTTPANSNADRVTIIAQNLDTPWSLVFLPDNTVLITERPGRVRHIDAKGNLETTPVATLSQVKEIGEGGLLGMTLSPDFASNHFIYFYYTYKDSGSGNTLNRVVRMDYSDGKLSNEKILVDAIPGASNHNGGRIKFGSDKLLYIGTGDGEVPSHAQDTNSLAGKILRVTENGDPASGNPFNNRVYSYGHRNVQGLAWNKDGQLFATEHGPSGLQSCCDEVNKIELGKNYGWPIIQDTQTKEGMVTPIKSSGKDTWAPSGMAYLNNSLYFAGLRGQTLYKATLQGNSIVDFKEYLKGEYGRLRDVVVGPDGMLYITTSNQDGRGTPKAGDDKILRIDAQNLAGKP